MDIRSQIGVKKARKIPPDDLRDAETAAAPRIRTTQVPPSIPHPRLSAPVAKNSARAQKVEWQIPEKRYPTGSHIRTVLLQRKRWTSASMRPCPDDIMETT
jgi:hypothetical protein